MQSRTPRAVLLDALGTLLSLAPPAPLLRDELAARCGVEVGEEAAAAAIAAEIAYYRAHLDEGRDVHSLAELRTRCAEIVRDSLAELVEVDLGTVRDALLAALRFSEFDDVRPALEGLRARGVRLVVVSNWDMSLHKVIDDLGLRALLDGVITSAEAGVRKPSPRIFQMALNIAGVAAADAVHVGDSLEEDVAGARAAGIEAILISRSGDASAPDVRVIQRLDEL